MPDPARTLQVHYASVIDQHKQIIDAMRARDEACLKTVIRDHIALYVNAYSQDLGKDGLAAVTEFFRRGRAAGSLPKNEQSLTLSLED